MERFYQPMLSRVVTKNIKNPLDMFMTTIYRMRKIMVISLLRVRTIIFLIFLSMMKQFLRNNLQVAWVYPQA